jgi:nucleotide-binding universal stress UspA family protein
MKRTKRILVAVDDSKASMRAVSYVASIIQAKREYAVCLLHVLRPVPPELMEFGGSEDPEREEKLEQELKDKREQWIEKAKTQASPILKKAKSAFKKAGIPANAVKTEFWISTNGEGVAGDILDAARLNKCNTVVVGRKSFSWLKKIFSHHVADELIRKAHDLTVWVVE